MPTGPRRPAASPSPSTVAASNQARLAERYGLQWSVPTGTPVADLDDEAAAVHAVADLLSGANRAAAPRGAATRLLDLGAGAGCLRSFVAASEYGWRSVAVNRDQGAHRWGRQIVRINRAVAGLIEGRHQPDAAAWLAGLTTPGERFAACLYAPDVGGGRDREVESMACLIAESATRRSLCRWFTAVVSTRAAVRRLRDVLITAGASEVRDPAMAGGGARRVLLAWTYTPPRT